MCTSNLWLNIYTFAVCLCLHGALIHQKRKGKKTPDNTLMSNLGHSSFSPLGRERRGRWKLTIPLFHRGHRVCLSVVRDVLECTRMHAMALSL